jgi:hypothetical protein
LLWLSDTKLTGIKSGLKGKRATDFWIALDVVDEVAE